MAEQLSITNIINEENIKIKRRQRNKKWYNERGNIQAKIKSIMVSNKHKIDTNECYFALNTQYKPTDELKIILNRLRHYVLLKELY